jgi:heme/copper-type cytochrome/quinol oxidase subunit 3
MEWNGFGCSGMAEQVIEAQLSRQEQLDLKNKRTGLLLFQVSWYMTFVCLVIVNFWFRGQATVWPPAGMEPEWILPSLMTLTLVVSSIFVRRGVKAIQAGDTARFLQDWRITLIGGVIFAIVMGYEFVVAPGEGIYLSVYRVMIAFHHLHAMACLYYLWRVYRAGGAGAYGPTHFWPVEGGSGLWNFVTLSWLMFWFVLYVI